MILTSVNGTCVGTGRHDGASSSAKIKSKNIKYQLFRGHALKIRGEFGHDV